MKLSLAILVLALLGICYGQYTYTNIAYKDFSKYPKINELRNLGLNFVIDDAYTKGHITSKAQVLQTTNTLGYRKSEGNDNEFYKFNCSLANGEKLNETLLSTFVARYNTKTGEEAIATWSYYYKRFVWIANPTTGVVPTDPEPEEEEEEEEVEEAPAPVEEEEEEEEEEQDTWSIINGTIVYNWLLLPSAQYTSDFNVDNAAYGLNYFVKNEVAKGNISNGTYTVSKIDEIYRQIMPNVTNYRYHITGDRAEDTYIYDVTFGLSYPNTTNTRRMGFYRFQTLDANGKPIGTGTLPDLDPLQNVTVNTTTVVKNPKLL